MERRDYLLNDIEKIGVVVVKLLRLKDRKKEEPEILEIQNGLSELFDVDLRIENLASIQSKISTIQEPEKLNYLIELLDLEMEIDSLLFEEKLLREQVLNFTRAHLEAMYAELKIAIFHIQPNKI